ncbi:MULTISPECIES: H-NS histone family protein [Paraburkholderia]|uniref:H-NS histone family protein n=1 Tax=Paraburkholderia madseniana TaxID=2599607 RepID=A0AAP5BK56_9BURK|nr:MULTISPECIES: H-NS histone family protein [Paraburkholderia]MCX4151014.1 H-NS histone family protein [Paraburkholderia madseniana]MCX4176654.1 H-NS histone family protein [Paraburkholderia madseniana]MDN7153946.1 H-NS histone family protein [Paraburkholderia sp. WS6]MDQ6412828.1 H-NS histone family protein [Paraburkholderia madseniana]MDQ6464645.1 H-NS histone family protein [Paraburkholderia madseniana]
MTDSTYETLLAQRATLEKQIEAAKNAEKSAVVKSILEKMNAYSISLSDLANAARRKSRRRAEIRYRDPSSGETWSGRGRPPRWIDGKDRTPFQV